MKIRMASPDHLEAAAAIQRAVIPDGHPYEYARNILAYGTLNLVARSNGVIVGYTSVLIGGLNPAGAHLWQRLRPYLAFVGVLPEFQGQHIGTALIQRALQLSDPHGASGMWLECTESAAGFYEKAGFSRVAAEAVQQHCGIPPKGLVYRITRHSERVGS